MTIFSTSTGVQKQSSEYDLLKLPSVIWHFRCNFLVLLAFLHFVTFDTQELWPKKVDSFCLMSWFFQVFSEAEQQVGKEHQDTTWQSSTQAKNYLSKILFFCTNRRTPLLIGPECSDLKANSILMLWCFGRH